MTDNSKAVQKRRGRGKPFPKGVSGNPGGRPKAEKEVALAIQLRGQELVDKLFALIGEGNVVALKEAFDRGYGKAKQVLEVSGPGGGPLQLLKVDPRRLTAAQLDALLALQHDTSDEDEGEDSEV